MKIMEIRNGSKCKSVVDTTDGQRIDSTCCKNKGRSETDKSMDEPSENEDFHEDNEPFYDPGIAD